MCMHEDLSDGQKVAVAAVGRRRMENVCSQCRLGLKLASCAELTSNPAGASRKVRAQPRTWSLRSVLAGSPTQGLVPVLHLVDATGQALPVLPAIAPP